MVEHLVANEKVAGSNPVYRSLVYNLCPREDSNLYFRLRRPAFYPLNYEDLFAHLPGFEPRITASKAVVISISLQVPFEGIIKGSMNNVKVPQHVTDIMQTLEKGGFVAYLVGGCVRDMFMKKTPSDWDIATNAHPKQVQALFSDSVYENEFGTVAVKVRHDDSVEIVEVTTFRKEMGYSDNRHPDSVVFAETIEEDLARRDFTINALALHMPEDEWELVDVYGGEKDINKKLIRAVGDTNERFSEDALRMMRAVRFFSQLGFSFDQKTKQAIIDNTSLLSHIASERIRDEFIKLIMGDDAADALRELQETGLLKEFIPELDNTVGVEQNLHHIYTVWEHLVRSLAYAVKKEYSLEIRLSALFHDIGKPSTKEGEGRTATFYNHEVAGAKITRTILQRLHFPKKILGDVVHLVRQHQFNYNVGEVSEAGVRRLLKRVGPEYIDDLIKVRESDRIGSGVPKAVPYKLRHLLFMIEKVKRDPISPKMMAIDGDDIMRVTGLKPSSKVGMIINALMEEVLEDPDLNTKKYLESRAKELSELVEKELQKRAEGGKKKQKVLEKQEETKIKKQFWVK